MKITDMAKRDKIDLNTIEENDYIIWYVEQWFLRNKEDYSFLKNFTFNYLATTNSIREVFNSVSCDASDSYHCDIVPKRGSF